MSLPFIKTTSVRYLGWHKKTNDLISLATLDVMELNWLKNYFPTAGLINFRWWNCKLPPRLRTGRNTGNRISCTWHICIDTKLSKLLIKISLIQNKNIKDAIISGVPDLRDIFANELIIWRRKLMCGFGSANFRVCEYKCSEKIRPRQNPSG